MKLFTKIIARLIVLFMGLSISNLVIAQCVVPVISSISNTGPTCVGGTVTLKASGTVGGLSSSSIRMVGIGANVGNQAFNQVFSSHDRPGTIARVSNAAIAAIMDAHPDNASKAAAVKAQYDVLMYTWASPSDPAHVNWGFFEAFLATGGSIFFDGDYNNIGNLSPGITGYQMDASSGCNYILVNPAPFPVLVANGVNGCFANNHIAISSWPSWMQPYIMAAGNANVQAVAGIYPGGNHGRLIIQGPDQDFHASRGGTGSAGNQYKIMLNQIDFLSANQGGFSWTGPNGFTSNETNPVISNVTPANAGTYTATLTNTTGGGCTTTATTEVVINGASFTTTSTGITCNRPNTGTITINATGTAPFEYSIDNGVSYSSNNTFTALAAGTYKVVVKGNGCVAAAQTVVITNTPDLTAPVPDIENLPTIIAECSATVAAPTATDNCAGKIIGTTLDPTSFTAQGTYLIHWSYNDGNGNISSQDQNVIVRDVTAPTFTSTASILTANVGGDVFATSAGGAIVNYQIPTATDNCTTNVSVTAVPASGSVFSIGNTTVVATATDEVGNRSSTSFVVSVVGIKPSVVVNNFSQNTDPGKCGAAVNFAASESTAIPAATISYTEAGITVNSGDYFTTGSHTITATATNSVGSDSKDFTITVVDVEKPVLGFVPADATVPCNAVPEAAVVTATDNCAATVVMTELRIDGATANDYTLVRTWTATDAAGNSSSQSQTIKVQDIEAPSLTVPMNISVNTDNNVCGATVNFAATATDNCATPVITYSQNPNTVFPVGTTTVTVTAIDASGNQTQSSFTITVADHQAPVAIAKNITLGLGTQVGGLVSITAADVNDGSTDACGIASMTVVPASFGCGNIGANTVTLTVTDVNGNVSTTTAVVTVVDDKGPVPTVTNLPTITGQCYATVLTLKPGEHEENHDGDDDHEGIELDHYYLVAPTAMDNCTGLAKGTTTDPLTYYNQGTYTIHWKYVDARGNVTIQEQTVIVKDTYAPVPKYATLPMIKGECSVTIRGNGKGESGEDKGEDDSDHSNGAWAKDNCSGWIRGTTTDPLTYTTQGTYTIHWTYNDGHGNIKTQEQTVIVKDITAPKISAPKDKTIACGSSILPAVTGMATATDNCAIPVITFTDVNSGTQITRTWKATDGAGNSSTAVQIIKLTPAFTAVVASTPTSTVYTGGSKTNLYLGYGAQSTTLSVTGLPAGSYTYNWSGANLSNTTSATPVFTATAAGVTTLYVTVTNANGCSSTASIAICVTDIRVPGSNGALVYVCHVGTGKTGGTQTLSVPVAQVAAHLNNTCTNGKGGDRLGSCSSNPCNTKTEVSAVDPKSQDAIEIVTLKSDVTATPATEDLTVTVMPNPSTTYFTLKFVSKDTKTPISLRVMDASGRAIDSKQQIDPSSTIQIGISYPSGTFYTEVIQGNKRKTVQLIKARG